MMGIGHIREQRRSIECVKIYMERNDRISGPAAFIL